jgi:hypothetical protein
VRVLVVEDDPKMARLVQRGLGEEGMHTDLPVERLGRPPAPARRRQGKSLYFLK